MKKFKEFLKPNYFIAFSNAGGRPGQYDNFDYSESFLHGQGGGPEEFEENLNPRNEPQYIKTGSRILFDPEKNNNGIGEEWNSPENIGTPNYHYSPYVIPHYNDEQAKHIRALISNTNDSHPDYEDIVPKYTSNSYNLNNTLLQHHRNGTPHPRHIASHFDFDDEDDDSYKPLIDTHAMDELINSHRLPHDMTVYFGLHFHPNEHRGKIAHLPAYLSTSISPHVAKDFGNTWDMSGHDGNNYKTIKTKNILRLHLPKGHPHLFNDNASLFPGQGELILPRGMRYQLGQKPTHIIDGDFESHFDGGVDKKRPIQYLFWTGRILPRK